MSQKSDWLRAGHLGFEFPQEQVFQELKTASCITFRKATSPDVKRPVREADNSPLYSAEFKNAWSYTCTLLYVFISWCLIQHMDNFTFYIPNFSHMLLLCQSRHVIVVSIQICYCYANPDMLLFCQSRHVTVLSIQICYCFVNPDMLLLCQSRHVTVVSIQICYSCAIPDMLLLCQSRCYCFVNPDMLLLCQSRYVTLVPFQTCYSCANPGMLLHIVLIHIYYSFNPDMLLLCQIACSLP
jgi:hypothetical protein